MSLRESAVSGIEGLLQGRFPGAAMSRGQEGNRDNISVSALDEDVDQVAADVRVIIDSVSCVAFNSIFSDTVSDDNWKLSGMLRNTEAPCATITMTYIRSQTKLLVSLVWIGKFGDGQDPQNPVHADANGSSVIVSGSNEESLGHAL